MPARARPGRPEGPAAARRRRSRQRRRLRSRRVLTATRAASVSDPLKSLRQRCDDCLQRALAATAADAPPRLLDAMRHGVLAGGKRLRPLLVYGAGQACGAALPQLDAAATAIELLHAYSLIHDDLPAMDDDDLRRGLPTVHKAWDEATAILAGDALQALAFEVIAAGAGHGLDAAIVLAQCRELARAAG